MAGVGLLNQVGVFETGGGFLGITPPGLKKPTRGGGDFNSWIYYTVIKGVFEVTFAKLALRASVNFTWSGWGY